MMLKRHGWLLGLGLAAIVSGYVLLAAQRLSWGPVLLVVGYCVLLPLFIWILFHKGNNRSDVAPTGGRDEDKHGLRVGE